MSSTLTSIRINITRLQYKKILFIINNIFVQLHSIGMKNEHLAKYKNPVIIKDEQGKVRQTCYDLPGQSHTYGKRVVDDPEPIKTVVNHWKNAEQSQDMASKHKNFQQLNKKSATQGFFTAKHQTEFRKHNDVMVQAKKGKKVIPIMLPEEQFTYGVPNRPSTPVKLVVGNCYAIQQQNKNATMYQTQANKNVRNKTVAQKTKSQLLRETKVNKQKQYRNKPFQQSQFKLSKFTEKNQTKIDTNLSAFQNVIKSTISQKQQNANQSAV